MQPDGCHQRWYCQVVPKRTDGSARSLLIAPRMVVAEQSEGHQVLLHKIYLRDKKFSAKMTDGCEKKQREDSKVISEVTKCKKMSRKWVLCKYFLLAKASTFLG